VTEPDPITRSTGRLAKATIGLDIGGSIAASEVDGGRSVGAPRSLTSGFARARSGQGGTDLGAGRVRREQAAAGAPQDRQPAVVVRTLKLPLIEDQKELETAIRFQAHDQIPMPLDQAVLDHRVLRRQPGPEGDRRWTC
jgi:type IV pilus assembly protein PilM